MTSVQKSKSPFTKAHYLYGMFGVLLIAMVLAFGAQGNLLGGNFTSAVSGTTVVTAAQMKLVPDKLTYAVGETGTAAFHNVPANTVLYKDGCGKLFYTESYAADNMYVVTPGDEPCPGVSQSVTITEGYQITFSAASPGTYHVVAVMGAEGSPTATNLVSPQFAVE